MPLTEDITYTIDPPVALVMRTLRGTEITLHATVVETSDERIDVAGSLSFIDWVTVMDHGAFHVDLDSGDLPDEFDKPVDVTLLLRVAFAFDYDDAEVLMQELFGDEPSVLHATDAWLMGEAMQSVDVPDGDGATSATGFRTMWARPLI